jgi:hypothetical protein
MTNETDQRAENLYMDVFGIAAANGDFVEPEEGIDLLLTEAFIASLAATILTATLGGFFGELGKGFLEKLRKRPFRQGELVETEPEVLIAELARRMVSGELDAARLQRARDEVNLTLQKLGVADEIGQRIAGEVLAAVERNQNGS